MNKLKYIFILLILPLFFSSKVCNGQSTVEIKDPAFKQYFIDSLPHLLNGSNELIIDSANAFSGTLHCRNLGISEVPEIVHFKKADEIVLDSNNISHLPDIDQLDSLTAIYFMYNDVQKLPKINKSQLQGIYFINNQIDDLSELSAPSALVGALVRGNNLSFEDLEVISYLTEPLVLYEDQKDFPYLKSTKLLEGDDFTIEPFDYAVNNSKYRLYKNNILIDSVDAPNSFHFENVTSDLNGEYYLEMTNSFFINTTIKTTKFRLTVAPNDEAYFSPNGDNQEDTFLIDMTGEIKIYNRSGQLLKSFNGPTEWDGTDNNGQLLPSDAYIIQSSNGERLTLSVIR